MGLLPLVLAALIAWLWSCGLELGVTDGDLGYDYDTWRQLWIELRAVTPGSVGLFSVSRTVGGRAVTIDGRVVNAVPRIGTAYIKP